MSDQFNQFTKRFEIFANAQQAEIEAVRAVMQGLIASLFQAHPRGAELFADLRTNVVARLDTETKLQSHDQDELRKASLVLEMATRIFDEIEPVFQNHPTSPNEKN